MDLLLKNMQTMQEQMKTMQKGQEETCMRLARQSHKDSYVFKKKGNECQYKANEEVKERLEVAAGNLDRVEAASGKEQLNLAWKEIAEGTSFLARRQKLIKLADRSESRWAVVEEYDADVLADDSDDEKKIEKAEKAAKRKLAKRRKVQEVKLREGLAARSLPRPGSEPTPKAPFASPKPAIAAVPRPKYPVGSCFQCGDPGHFRRECPRAAPPAGAREEYPLIQCVEHGAIEGMECVDREKVAPDLGEVLNVGESSRCWKAQEGEASTVSVRGCLGACITYSEEVLYAPPWVLETLRNGYVLPFYSRPTPYAHPNQHSAQIEADFVTNAVADLLNGGYIEKVNELPVVCSPLSVVTNGVGKKRLVVNLRHVNQSLWSKSSSTKTCVWQG